MAIANRKVDRNQIYKEIVKLIDQNESGEVEISSSELADQFNVQAPTMDYHLNKLVDEGLLFISPKRGRYNRKIYRKPTKVAQEVAKIHTPNDTEAFKKFLQEHVSKTKEKKEQSVQEELNLDQEEVPQKKTEELPEKEFTLDEKIQQFLQQASQVHGAEMLLKHQDKEILSVMNETINQTVVYLKDLSEQLSTVQSKDLIQHLIDDRNRMQKEVDKMQEELDATRKQAEQTIEKYEIDPKRVRFMHQMMIDTIDNFVNQPNHAMALGRNEFRSKVSKEVGDLVKYVLHLEE